VLEIAASGATYVISKLHFTSCLFTRSCGAAHNCTSTNKNFV